MRVRIALVAVVASGCGMLAASLAAQGARQQDPDVLGALLTEVRGLRQAMEQMASAGPRVQLALGRLQLQEQRLNTMIRRLESVRDSVGTAERVVADLQGELSRFQEGLKQMEGSTDAEDVQRARAVAAEIPEVKRRLAVAQQEAARWQGEESTLQQQIANEQARWAEINRMLEDLERALGKR